jgi:UDP-N-acetylmuramate dehydrogenase
VHANWFVNTGGATAADMLELIDIARAAVARTHGVQLELEWKILGEQ